MNYKSRLSLILVVAIFFQLLIPSNIANAAVNIVYHGPVSYGDSKVGDFTVDGVQAFCIQHALDTPTTGTPNNGGMIYNDKRIKAVLYYGWGGPENIFGGNRNLGIVVTSLVLDAIYSGGTTGRNLPKFAELMAHANAQDAPERGIHFSNTSVDTRMENGVQRSLDIQLQMDVRYQTEFFVPYEITFNNYTTGHVQQGGVVSVKGGDIFYFTAPLTYDTRFFSGECNSNEPNYTPVIYVPNNPDLQTLAAFPGGVDPIPPASFYVNFKKFTTKINVIHIDRISRAVLGTDRVDKVIGEPITVYPNPGFKKGNDPYRVIDQPKTIYDDVDVTVEFIYDPPIKATINHIDNVTKNIIRTDYGITYPGDSYDYAPVGGFMKNNHPYRPVSHAHKTGITPDHDFVVDFFYDPPIFITIEHIDQRVDTIITKDYDVSYPGDPFDYAPRGDLKRGEYNYRPISNTHRTGNIPKFDFTVKFYYDSPLLDIGMNTLRIYTEEASIGLPVELEVDRTNLYDLSLSDMDKTTVDVNLYQDNLLINSKKYTAKDLPTEFKWTVPPEFLTVNENKPYTVKFENFNSDDFFVETTRAEITTDGYTSSELNVKPDKVSTNLNYKGVIMTEKKFSDPMKTKYEYFTIPIKELKRIKTGYGFKKEFTLSYTNELNKNLTGIDKGYSFVTTTTLKDSHLDYESENDLFITPFEQTKEETSSSLSFEGSGERSKKTDYTFELPRVFVERKTGNLFTDKQVELNDNRITRELVDGDRKFYIPFWIDLGNYSLTQKSNDRLGVNKITTEIEQDLSVYAYMYAHMNSPTINEDSILMIPVDMDNPFGGKIPDGWSQSDINWIKNHKVK